MRRLSYSTQDRLETAGAIVLVVVLLVVTAFVYVVLVRAMWHAAQRHDTAMVLFYGVILAIFTWGSSHGRRSR